MITDIAIIFFATFLQLRTTKAQSVLSDLLGRKIYMVKHRRCDKDVGRHVPDKPCLDDSVISRTFEQVPRKYGGPTIPMDLIA
jgi:hypothetical protein